MPAGRGPEDGWRDEVGLQLDGGKKKVVLVLCVVPPVAWGGLGQGLPVDTVPHDQEVVRRQQADGGEGAGGPAAEVLVHMLEPFAEVA